MRNLDSILESQNGDQKSRIDSRELEDPTTTEDEMIIAALKKENEEQRQQNLRLLAAQEDILKQYEEQEHQLATLKKENEEQRQQNARLLAAQENIFSQYEEQTKTLQEFKSREAGLMSKIEAQRASLTFMFADLEKAKKRVEQLESQVSGIDSSCDPKAQANNSKRPTRQEDFLPAMKTDQTSRRFLSSFSKDFLFEQQTIRRLEEENEQLKNDYVLLHTQFRKAMTADNMTAATESSSDGSIGSAGSLSNSSSDSSIIQQSEAIKEAMEGGKSYDTPPSSPLPPVRVPKKIQTNSQPPVWKDTDGISLKKAATNNEHPARGLLTDTRRIWRERRAAINKLQSPTTPVRTGFLSRRPYQVVHQHEDKEFNLHDLAL